MINAIMESISISLHAEFGDTYEIYREVKKQGLKEPCFFIQCLNPTNKLFFHKRYFRQNQFCIQYFPNEKQHENQECYTVGEQLFSCLEYLEVEGSLVMGTKMRYEVMEGILHFFVNYDMFVYKAGEPLPVMEKVLSTIARKGKEKE